MRSFISASCGCRRFLGILLCTSRHDGLACPRVTSIRCSKAGCGWNRGDGDDDDHGTTSWHTDWLASARVWNRRSSWFEKILSPGGRKSVEPQPGRTWPGRHAQSWWCLIPEPRHAASFLEYAKGCERKRKVSSLGASAS